MKDEEDISSKLVVQLDSGQQVKRLNLAYREIDSKLTILQDEYIKHSRTRSSFLRGCALLLSDLPH